MVAIIFSLSLCGGGAAAVFEERVLECLCCGDSVVGGPGEHFADEVVYFVVVFVVEIAL